MESSEEGEMQCSVQCSAQRTCVADTRVVNLNPNLVCLRRGDLDVLNAQLLPGLPGDGGLARDRLIYPTWSATLCS